MVVHGKSLVLNPLVAGVPPLCCESPLAVRRVDRFPHSWPSVYYTEIVLFETKQKQKTRFPKDLATT